jgi:hypothetical protein
VAAVVERVHLKPAVGPLRGDVLVPARVLPDTVQDKHAPARAVAAAVRPAPRKLLPGVLAGIVPKSEHPRRHEGAQRDRHERARNTHGQRVRRIGAPQQRVDSLPQRSQSHGGIYIYIFIFFR